VQQSVRESIDTLNVSPEEFSRMVNAATTAFYGDLYFWLAIVGLINGVISLYYYMRVVKAMYFGKIELPATVHHAPVNVTVLLVILAVWPGIVTWLPDTTNLSVIPLQDHLTTRFVTSPHRGQIFVDIT